MGIPRKERKKFLDGVIDNMINVDKRGFLKFFTLMTGSSLLCYYLFSDYRKYIKNNLIVREVERMRLSEGYRHSQVHQDIHPYQKLDKFSTNYGIDFLNKTDDEESEKK
jgi:hypothetical protein